VESSGDQNERSRMKEAERKIKKEKRNQKEKGQWR